MARNPIQVRDAVPADAGALVGFWRDTPEAQPLPPAPDVASAERAIGHLALDSEQRLLVAVVDGQVVGTSHLARTPLSPIHEEPAVRVSYLFVREGHRRRGVGRALLGAATAWADEKQTAHLMTNVPTTSRDGNRFLARLGMASITTVRAIRVCALQERLARAETAASADGPIIVERLRTLRRRQASLRSAGRKVPG
ncbi:MAG: GNAT family N-acetyltransferase [Nocardioidaceae bacterium]